MTLCVLQCHIDAVGSFCVQKEVRDNQVEGTKLSKRSITVFKACVGNRVCNVELETGLVNFRRPDSMSCRRLTPCLRLGRLHYIVPCILW